MIQSDQNVISWTIKYKKPAECAQFNLSATLLPLPLPGMGCLNTLIKVNNWTFRDELEVKFYLYPDVLNHPRNQGIIHKLYNMVILAVSYFDHLYQLLYIKDIALTLILKMIFEILDKNYKSPFCFWGYVPCHIVLTHILTTSDSFKLSSIIIRRLI